VDYVKGSVAWRFGSGQRKPMPNETSNADNTIDDVFIKAARQLLRWDQSQLAAEIGKHATMVRRLELGQKVSPSLRQDVLDALRRGGVEFLPACTIGGIPTVGGVALRAENKMGPRKVYQKRRIVQASLPPDHRPTKP
jgi:hypothetical protein